ncbi:hypothetical protein GCM10023085_80980 [Actinomadura viridis]|uniref:Uncharacterized protein n=1 Tax=Actinomadura viridis TaxID=58110 RepID=A0A931DLC1_9ACTN|nr:hypothetical protein [Actinomadura viridis]
MPAHELAPGRTDFHERILQEGLAADSAVGPATARPDGPVAVLYREGATLFAIMDGRLERVAAPGPSSSGQMRRVQPAGSVAWPSRHCLTQIIL